MHTSKFCCMKILRSIQLSIPIEVCSNTVVCRLEFCRFQPFLMDTLLEGLPKVCVYLDDILVAGVDEADHLNNLSKVLDKLEEAGLMLKESKCAFSSSSIEYLGLISPS